MTPTPETWLGSLKAGLDAVRYPERWMARPPEGVPAADLLGALKILCPNYSGPAPAEDAAELIAGRIGNLKAALQDLVKEVVPWLVGAVAQHTAEVGDLVRPEEFGRPLLEISVEFGHPEHPGGPRMKPVVLYFGALDSLPEGHPLRTQCQDPYIHGAARVVGPLDERAEPTLRYEGGIPVVVLGTSDPEVISHVRPREWYSIPDALKLTERMRAGQREGDRKFLEKAKVAAASERNRQRNSPLGRLEEQLRQLKAEKRAGRLPATGWQTPDPDADPGVSLAEQERQQEELRKANESWERKLRQVRAEARALRDTRRHDEAVLLSEAIQTAERLRAQGDESAAGSVLANALATLIPQEVR